MHLGRSSSTKKVSSSLFDNDEETEAERGDAVGGRHPLRDVPEEADVQLKKTLFNLFHLANINLLCLCAFA